MRWIIEAVNGRLWKHKALNNVDNNELGHIIFDVRNVCAMLNFQHNKETYQKDPDNVINLEIARRLKKKATEDPQINRLIFLLKQELFQRKLENRDNWIQTTFNNIVDFPKLKKKQIVRIITLGSYQPDSSIDYVPSMLYPERIYEMSLQNALNTKELMEKDNTDFRNKLIKKKSKIIAVIVTSRHSRGTPKIYNVFVRYKPIELGNKIADEDTSQENEEDKSEVNEVDTSQENEEDRSHVNEEIPTKAKKKCVIYNIEGNCFRINLLLILFLSLFLIFAFRLCL